jgi:hypothetical protein
VRDLVDNYERAISDLETNIRLKDEEIMEKVGFIREEQQVNDELSTQIKTFQSE